MHSQYPSKRGRSRSTEEAQTVRALERGLAVLECLSKNRLVTLSGIARDTDLSTSTAARLLETLRKCNYVSQDGSSGRYTLTPKALALSAPFLSGSRLLSAAGPIMQRLVNEVKETANLAVLEGTEAVYVHQVECSNVVRMFTRLGAHVPIHCSGVGKVLVANFADDDIRKLLGNGPLPRFTSATITDIDALLKELKRVRTKDYAVDNEEREEGVRCVTASIRDRSGMTVAGLSVSGPTTRMLMKRIRKLADAVIGAADEISAALGFSKSPRNGES